MSNYDLAVKLAHARFSGGVTLNVHTETSPICVYTIGGQGTLKLSLSEYPSTPALEKRIEKWLGDYFHTIPIVGNVGAWKDGDDFYLDIVETIYTPSPNQMIKKAVNAIAYSRNELAFGYIDVFGQFTEYQTKPVF